METARPTTPPYRPETVGCDRPGGEYYVVRGEVVVRGFHSFYGAYMYALNRFGSEDFLVQKEGW